MLMRAKTGVAYEMTHSVQFDHPLRTTVNTIQEYNVLGPNDTYSVNHENNEAN